MRLPTPEHVKSAVIDAWMMGKARDKIALEFTISTGTISNIIEQWQNKIGVYDAKNLRDLGVALKKAKITPLQCVDGLRITNIITQLGINEDHLIDFLQNLFNESNEQRLEPADIAELVKIIKAFPEINSLKEIPKYINRKRQEKIKLDSDIYYRNREIEKLNQEIIGKKKEIQDLKEDFDSVRKEMQDEKKEFLLFKDVKNELKKNSIEIHLLEPLIDVIKIFQEMHFKPLKILSEFSNIKEYRDLVENKERKIKEIKSHIKDLKAISDNYEMKIASNESMVLSIKKLENIGFDASDIKNLERTFLDISKKYGLNKEEIKIKFYRYMDRLYSLLTLEQETLEKRDKLSVLNGEISSGRKIIEESQPIVFSILQKLVNAGLNENSILLAFKIFKTDMCNNMPFSDRTYLESLSKDLDAYKTVRDTLIGLNTKILLKKSHIDKLVLYKTNLETFLFSLAMTIYFYFLILNIQLRIQKKLRILLIYIFTYLPFVYILKISENTARSKYKIKSKRNNNKKIKTNRTNKLQKQK